MNGEGSGDRWIRRYHRGADEAVRLVCFPHAGGSASFYHPFSAALSPTFEVLALQYPGRQDRRRERPADSIHDLAEGITAALIPWTDRPLALFGHSMGAVLAFEVARRLEEAADAKLVTVFASGRRAPSRLRDEDVHLRDDDGVLAELKRMNGTDGRLLDDDELLRMVLPAVRADYRAIETYRVTEHAALRCPVVVLVGDDDPQVTPDEARAWRDHATGDFELYAFPGGHFYLADRIAEVVATIANVVRARYA